MNEIKYLELKKKESWKKFIKTIDGGIVIWIVITTK